MDPAGAAGGQTVLLLPLTLTLNQISSVCVLNSNSYYLNCGNRVSTEFVCEITTLALRLLSLCVCRAEDRCVCSCAELTCVFLLLSFSLFVPLPVAVPD